MYTPLILLGLFLLFILLVVIGSSLDRGYKPSDAKRASDELQDSLNHIKFNNN